MSTKIENAIYTDPQDNTMNVILYDALDTDLYEEKYKGLLTCINGCKARIKFTQRKDGNKFFSTWNKEGFLHEIGCQYHVDYKGRMGRKKLKALYEDAEVDTDHIKRTIKNKIANLKKINTLGNEKPIKLTTTEVEDDGEKEVLVPVDGQASEINKNKRIYIGSLDAELLDPSYVSTRKCVFGKINNVQIREISPNEKYAYMNLDNTRHNVSVYLPPAFHNAENNSLSKFEQFVATLENVLNSDIEYQFVGVGFIEFKKKEGINIRILDKDHFVINEMDYDNFLIQNRI